MHKTAQITNAGLLQNFRKILYGNIKKQFSDSFLVIRRLSTLTLHAAFQVITFVGLHTSPFYDQRLFSFLFHSLFRLLVSGEFSYHISLWNLLQRRLLVFSVLESTYYAFSTPRNILGKAQFISPLAGSFLKRLLQ